MKEEHKLGMNKTGIDMSPLQSKEMAEGSDRLTRIPPGNEDFIGKNRIKTIQESDPVGSIPLPGSMKGMAKTGLQMMKGHDPKLLIDKLGERVAFERAGVRLYDALISKHRAHSDSSLVVPLARLEEFRNEELQHFHLVSDVMLKLGADPTAQTPAADIAAMTAMGIQKVLHEPRANFADSLEAVLIAELADNDCWNVLIRLTEEAGLDEVAESFRGALAAEQEHLASIRSWVEQLRLDQSQVIKKTA